MSDSFSETTSKGWFERIVESIKGVVVGLVIFVAAFPLLFWNEGRAVSEYEGILEGISSVVEASPDKVDPANQDKLIHLTGLATTTETLSDADFGVEINALRLIRKAEIYQWQEKERRETRKKIGGGEETVTTYDYEKVWAPGPINSSAFKKPEGHVNTGNYDIPSRTADASKITVGAFTLSRELASRIDKAEPVPLDTIDPKKASETVAKAWKRSGEWFYRGDDPASPVIGDMRVKFTAVKPTTVSLYAQQTGDSFRTYITKKNTRLERLDLGTFSAKEMFKKAEAENTMITWILRGVGLFLMWLGITMVFKPLVVVADVLPIFGNVLQAGIGAFALLFALPLTLITIAIAWLYYRPILGISLLAAAAVSFGLIYTFCRKKKPAAA